MKSFESSSFYAHSRFPKEFAPSESEMQKWNYLSKRYDAWINQESLPFPVIPKTLHQIWIGSPLPSEYKNMSDTWKHYHPGWDYILWDDEMILRLDNFPAKAIYQKAKSYGIKSDLARYEILRQYGGVYADTDFECIRPLDEIITKSTFVAGVIFGNAPGLANGLMGAVPHHPLINSLCEHTSRINRLTTEMMDIIDQTGPGLLSRLFFDTADSLGFSAVALPSQYFYPYPNFMKREGISRQEVHSFASAQSFAIHYWDVSWSKVDFISWLVRKFNRILKRLRFLR